MDRTTQAELIRRIFALREEKATDMVPAAQRVPASEYTSTDQLDLERRILFREGPVLAGLSADAANPGDFFTIEADGVPFVFIRGEDSSLRGFVNACRHRGAKVADGCGQVGRALVCPYHAWTYNLDGSLRAQPGSRGGFAEIDPGSLGLVAVPVAERHGLVFLRPGGGEPIEVDEVLGGAERDLASFGLDGYHHFETRTHVWRMNWKTVIDTFLEAYHIFSLHKRSIAPDYFSDTALFDPFGPNSRFVGVRSSITALRDAPEEEWNLLPHATIQYCLVPNALLVHQFDHFELWRVFPRGVGEAVVHTGLYAPQAPATEKAERYWRKNLDAVLSVTNSEDFPQCEQIQRNLESGAAPELVFGRNEPALVHFHQSLRKLIGLDFAPA